MTSNIDEQVRQAMRAAAGGIAPPVQELVDGGLAYGRKLRRRHRMVVGGTGLVAVTVVASGIVMATQFTAGPKDVAAPGDDTSRSVVEAAPANPGVSDAAEVSAEVEPISSEDVLETLIELLPPGEITDSKALPQDVVAGSRENPAAIVTFDDGAGAANVSVTPTRCEPKTSRDPAADQNPLTRTSVAGTASTFSASGNRCSPAWMKTTRSRSRSSRAERIEGVSLG